MKPYAPLGILYLASHLRARGFEVEVFDTTFSSWPELQKLLLLNLLLSWEFTPTS